MTNRISIAIAVLFLSACVDEVSPEIAGAAEVTEVEEAARIADDGDDPAACADDAADAAAALGLGIAPAAECPHGTKKLCNPSGACRCCWSWGSANPYCCPIATPYVWCNPSGVCRCSATPN